MVQAGTVLLIRRRVAESGLMWQFPAGKIEPGEPATAAAVRKTREETGLTVTDSRVLGERVHPATGRTMVYVACDVLDGEAHIANAREIADVAWAGRNDLASRIPSGIYPPVHEYLYERLRP